jgi:hypothetical protein
MLLSEFCSPPQFVAFGRDVPSHAVARVARTQKGTGPEGHPCPHAMFEQSKSILTGLRLPPLHCAIQA